MKNCTCGFVTGYDNNALKKVLASLGIKPFSFLLIQQCKLNASGNWIVYLLSLFKCNTSAFVGFLVSVLVVNFGLLVVAWSFSQAPDYFGIWVFIGLLVVLFGLWPWFRTLRRPDLIHWGRTMIWCETRSCVSMDSISNYCSELDIQDFFVPKDVFELGKSIERVFPVSCFTVEYAQWGHFLIAHHEHEHHYVAYWKSTLEDPTIRHN